MYLRGGKEGQDYLFGRIRCQRDGGLELEKKEVNTLFPKAVKALNFEIVVSHSIVVVVFWYEW